MQAILIGGRGRSTLRIMILPGQGEDIGRYRPFYPT
jgi:hypothetical protein